MSFLGNNMRSCTKLSYDREPLNQLLEAAVAAYVNTTHSRYISIDLLYRSFIKLIKFS